MISSSYPNPLSPQMKDTFPTSMEIFNSSTEKYNYIFLFDKTKSTFSIYTAFPRFVFVITIYYYFWVCLTNKLTAYLKALPLEKLTIFFYWRFIKNFVISSTNMHVLGLKCQPFCWNLRKTRKTVGAQLSFALQSYFDNPLNIQKYLLGPTLGVITI